MCVQYEKDEASSGEGVSGKGGYGLVVGLLSAWRMFTQWSSPVLRSHWNLQVACCAAASCMDIYLDLNNANSFDSYARLLPNLSTTQVSKS